jgi:hypothetical protein
MFVVLVWILDSQLGITGFQTIKYIRSTMVPTWAILSLTTHTTSFMSSSCPGPEPCGSTAALRSEVLTPTATLAPHGSHFLQVHDGVTHAFLGCYSGSSVSQTSAFSGPGGDGGGGGGPNNGGGGPGGAGWLASACDTCVIHCVALCSISSAKLAKVLRNINCSSGVDEPGLPPRPPPSPCRVADC